MLLPAAERRGDIHFLIGKPLPYSARMVLSFGLITAGLILQILLINTFFWIGVPMVFAGTLLLLTKGYENKPKAKRGTEQWRPARTEELHRILTLSQQQRKWDNDAVDATCVPGFFLLALATAAVAGSAMLVAPFAHRAVPMIIVNGGILLLPFWLTGVRSVLKTDRLVVKVKLLLGVEQTFQAMAPEADEEFQYQIETAEARGEVGQIPTDVKAILTFHQASADFLGLQMQVSINSVQGSDYPYFYCVLVARPAFGLLDKVGRLSPPSKVIVEPKREGDVDIIVIRQKTTKNSGYHTKAPAVRGITAFAIATARRAVR